MKNVLYTGAFRFPDEDAAAFRVFSIANLFDSDLYKVSFAGWEKSKDGLSSYDYKGFSCFSQDEFREGYRNPFVRLFGFLFRGIKTLRWLRANQRFDIVIAYNPPAIFSLLLLIYCRIKKIKVVLDSTEWYQADHLPGGRYGIAAAENWLRMNVIYFFFKNVICISVFLRQHYKAAHVYRVPPLADKILDEAELVVKKETIDNGIVFFYAGQIGKKDRILSFIECLPKLKTFGLSVVFEIAGIESAELNILLANAGLDPHPYRELVICHGRISHQSVFEIYKRAHFSILFRQNQRYALAGFPTKAMESWSNGTPIIANKVGDIFSFAKDGQDALFVDEEKIVSCLPARINEIASSGSYSDMVNHTIDLTKRHFLLESYLVSFRDFIARLK